MTLSKDLERGHLAIDEGIEAFSSGLGSPGPDVSALEGALDELRRHIYFEEEVLFPPLREAGLVPPLFVMVREHGQLWATMDDLAAKLTSEPDPAALRDVLDRLMLQLQEHNGKEEAMVYPAADRMIAVPTLDELRLRLAEIQRPADWVCQAHH